jgi:hypothetical protein
VQSFQTRRGQNGGRINDGFSTDNVFLAALIAYLYPWDSLLKVEASGPRFTFDAPSEDCRIIEEELDKGETSVLLNQYIGTYARLIGVLKALKRNQETHWVSNSWISGVSKDGRKLK